MGIADSTRTLNWHNQASGIANATSSLPLSKLVTLLTPVVDSSPSAHEFVYVRGLANARMGRWQDADADFSKALRLVPEKTALWHEYAYRQSFLLAYIGESERYGRLCQQALADFSDTTDAYLAERTVKMCLFSKDIRVDLQQAGELADRAYKSGTTLEWLKPYLDLSKGIADFRRGDFDSAIPILETVPERFSQTTWADPRTVVSGHGLHASWSVGESTTGARSRRPRHWPTAHTRRRRVFGLERLDGRPNRPPRSRGGRQASSRIARLALCPFRRRSVNARSKLIALHFSRTVDFEAKT